MKKIIICLSLAGLCLLAAVFVISPRLNRLSACETLKEIHRAEASYKSNNPSGLYGSLEDLQRAELISKKIGNASYKGYSYQLKIEGAAFHAVAVSHGYFTLFSQVPNPSFFIDETGIIRWTVDGSVADKGDPVVSEQ